MTSRNRQMRGFTLIELILVIVILGILAAMVVPNFVGVSDDAREAATRSDIVVIGNALDNSGLHDLVRDLRYHDDFLAGTCLLSM